MGDVSGAEIDAGESGLGVAGGLEAEPEALAATQIQHAECPCQIHGPLALQQGRKHQPLRRDVRIGPVGVALIAEVAVAQSHDGGWRAEPG